MGVSDLMKREVYADLRTFPRSIPVIPVSRHSPHQATWSATSSPTVVRSLTSVLYVIVLSVTQERNLRSVKCVTTHFRDHLRTHTEVKPHKCQVCEYSFVTSSDLRVDIRKHTDEKSHRCKVCDYSCTTSNGIRVHMRNHAGEKPHKCKVCAFSCIATSQLKVHIRKHTGEKPFKCKHCTKSFTETGVLVKHLQTHTNQYSNNQIQTLKADINWCKVFTL